MQGVDREGHPPRARALPRAGEVGQRRLGLGALADELGDTFGRAVTVTLRARRTPVGRMTAVVDDLPVVGEQHVVTGEHRGSAGRRTSTASTLHDSDGRIVARAEHVWVAVDPARSNG